jgi:hypothetical protein
LESNWLQNIPLVGWSGPFNYFDPTEGYFVRAAKLLFPFDTVYGLVSWIMEFQGDGYRAGNWAVEDVLFPPQLSYVGDPIPGIFPYGYLVEPD